MRATLACFIAVLVCCASGAEPEVVQFTEHSFRLARPAEVTLRLRASAPGTSWEQPGAEAAVLRVDLDGAYNQHVTLFLGAVTHDYRLLLGPLAAGAHRVRVSLDRAISSPAARGFEALIETRAWEPGEPQYEALRFAPILYLRPDTIGQASDAPLLAWYEWLPPASDAPAGAARMLQFSYVFSNEDGGTNTPALMARWGRTTDIEHLYRVFFNKAGANIGAIYQGVDHKEKPFQGQKVGEHRLIGVASRNNNFSDEQVSKARVALEPEAADLSQHSREELMDRHPWTYRVMAQEMAREGKLAEIGDLRDYLYLEARVRTATAAASFGIELKDGRAFRSDSGRADRRIDRSGWVRSTIRLPAGTSPNDLRRLVFFCDPPQKPPAQPRPQACSVEEVSRIFFLGRDYSPGPSLSIGGDLPQRLVPGASTAFDFARQ